MICLLGERDDSELLYLAAALERRGVSHERLHPEDLMLGAALTCRIDRSGVTSSVVLRDGRAWDADTPALIVNRLIELPPIGGPASPADASYLSEEWRATLAAWLRTLRCPVLNPPRAASLAGPSFPPVVWRSMASAQGLACRSWESGTQEGTERRVDIVCLGSRCIDPAGVTAAVHATGVVRLARRAGAPLLGASFELVHDEWVFTDATPCPGFSRFGDPLIDVLLECAREGEVPR